MAPREGFVTPDRLLVQIASYNTNLQGSKGLPQDLVDWLAPTLQVSTFLSRAPRPADIVAVGFQELLPLQYGLAGISRAVIDERADHILSQIEANAPNQEKFGLIAKIQHAGIALLVFGKDDGVARQVCDVQTTWTGCGPAYMGNKGAVGVRFCVKADKNDPGEVYTFVCAHLAAHKEQLPRRIWDYNHIVGSLLFPPSSTEDKPTTIYSTSHLFFLGDLNFRLDLPEDHVLSSHASLIAALDSQSEREAIKEYDQLLVEKRKGSIFRGFREGEFWQFKCSYKYKHGQADRYDIKRTPSWTDRVLYTTYSDSPDNPDQSNITNLLYTSVPGYTTSDHKPIVTILLLPSRSTTPGVKPPLLQLPTGYTPSPDPKATLKRYTGRTVDRIVGYLWCLITLLGGGSWVVGIFNFVLSIGAWKWIRSNRQPPSLE